MTVTTIDDTVQYKPDRATRKQIVKDAVKNAAAIGKTNETGGVSVYVEDVGTDILLGVEGLKHGLDRRLQENAAVTLKAGELLRNAIRINEVIPKKESASRAYVLLSAAKNAANEPYIVEFVVNGYDNTVASVDVLYSANAKKESAVLNAPKLTGNPLLVTDSTISIAQLLDLARENFPDILPESVLRHYGYIERPEGKLGESALFSRETAAPTALTEDQQAALSAMQEAVRATVREELDRMGKEYGWIKKGNQDSATISEMRYSLKEDLENGRARKESRDEFKRRCHKEGYSVFEEKGIAHGYRPVQREFAQQNARQVQEELRKLGISADIIDGEVLWNLNDISSSRTVPEAVTISSAHILINNDVDLSPRNVAGHEAFHLWKDGAGRDIFVETVEANLLFASEEFRGYQSAIVGAYLGKEADLSNQKQVDKLFEELFAYICGDIHEGVNDDFLRPMFRNYETVKSAWSTLIRENGGEQYSLKGQSELMRQAAKRKAAIDSIVQQLTEEQHRSQEAAIEQMAAQLRGVRKEEIDPFLLGFNDSLGKAGIGVSPETENAANDPFLVGFNGGSWKVPGDETSNTGKESIETGEKSDKIDAGGVLDNFSRKTWQTDFDEDLKAVNPNYESGEFKWTQNCQRCVVAYELRRRGYDVVAKPRLSREDYLAGNYAAAWENQTRVWCRKESGLEQIKAQMAKWGDGARAEVFVEWDTWPRWGHVFVAEQRNGKTCFIDPQTGSGDCSEYFKRVVQGKTNILRIDNNTPSDTILDCCEDRW